ncbi:MAG: sulfatase-like hydrolase/transferase [Lachnospiraceae bacterium]|nr:sulfatase-like hydrolase/transferase [Lachnospiraceae bacterium]
MEGSVTKKEKVFNIVFIILSVIFSVTLFIMMETVNGDLSQMIFPLGLLNLVLIFFLLITFFVITGSLRSAVIINSLFLLVFTLSDYFVSQFRGVPLLAPDLLVAKTAFSVAGGFTYTMSGAVKLYMILTFVIIMTAALFPAKVSLKGRLRLNAFLGYAVLAVIFIYLFIFSSMLEKAGATVSHFNPQRSYAENGGLVSFIRSGQMAVLKKPEGYSEDRVAKILEKYEKEYDSDAGEYKKPNVIVMMNEAFSDLQTVGKGFETDSDVMPFIHSLEENTIKGTAYSSVFGGYTANSEYEFLTGFSMEGLGGVAPFQFLIKSPTESLARDLEKEGYAAPVAMHPYIKSGYQRPLAYKQLGFSSYIALEDIEDKGYDTLRGYISDKADVRELISIYEDIRAKDDSPVFLYNVTMQNHAPYDGEYEDLLADVFVSDKELATDDLENYLSLIKRSDEAFESLVEYFENVDEDTVIVLFGDHEPKLGNKFYKKLLGKKVSKLGPKESMERYKVPYVIWTNYDIEKRDYGDISLNYLASIMAQASGMKLTPMQRYLLELRQSLPVVTAVGCIDANGDFYQTDDGDMPYRNMLDEYECIRYRALTDVR